MANVRLTHRALKDLSDILVFSEKKWNKQIAEKYIQGIEAGLKLLEKHPELLLIKPQISESFKLYQVSMHWLVCQVVNEDIYILTVKHTSMNLLERLQELQPTLEKEAAIFAGRLKSGE